MTSVSPARGRVVAIMPARNSARTIENTLREIPPGFVDELILVDNASRDDTVAIAERLGITVIRHPIDRGFGGSIKTLFHAALAADAEFIIELHPDNQYDAGDIPALLEAIRGTSHAMVIGSRFMPAWNAVRGGMPWWKFVANRSLTAMNCLLMGVRLSEFHSGLRVYSARWARTVPFERLSDDFKLGFQLVAHAVANGWTIGQIPTACRYFDEASSNPFVGSVVYGWGTLTESFGVFLYRLGLGGARLRAL
ncbi:MAG: glycosyltransferase family 2 protein [Vicinamibacterales bacterium]